MFAHTILDSRQKNFYFLKAWHTASGVPHTAVYCKSPHQMLLLRDATTTKNVLVLVARPENVKPLSKVQCSQAILVTLPVKNATVGNI